MSDWRLSLKFIGVRFYFTPATVDEDVTQNCIVKHHNGYFAILIREPMLCQNQCKHYVIFYSSCVWYVYIFFYEFAGVSFCTEYLKIIENNVRVGLGTEQSCTSAL